MKPFFTKRKAMALLSCAALTSLAVGATFAWTSLNSQKVNEWYGTAKDTDTVTGPGGSLHDDHDNEKGNDPMKDVYVENWGDKPIMVRVRLSEYMETGENAGSIASNAATGELYRNADNKSTPLIENSLTKKDGLDYLKFLVHSPSENNVTACPLDFHVYWNWIIGDSTANAKKIYKPATEAQKREASAEKGSVVSDSTIYASLTDDLKETLDGKVITMAQWLALEDNGNYWAYDEKDGWAYWSHPLKPGKATSLLVHKVERTSEKINGKYYYAINVHAQMGDMGNVFSGQSQGSDSDDDFTNWITGARGVEVASDEAKILLRAAYKEAVNEGLLGDDIEVDEEELDHIFTADSRR